MSPWTLSRCLYIYFCLFTYLCLCITFIFTLTFTFTFVVRSWPEEDAIASRLGLPADDRSILEQQLRIYYPALPIMLYLLSYATISLLSYVIHGVVVMLGRLLSPCLKGYNSVVLLYICIYGYWWFWGRDLGG